MFGWYKDKQPSNIAEVKLIKSITQEAKCESVKYLMRKILFKKGMEYFYHVKLKNIHIKLHIIS